MLIASRRGISAILTFLGEFEIVITGFAIVDCLTLSLYTKKQLEKFISSQLCPHMIKINETN